MVCFRWFGVKHLFSSKSFFIALSLNPRLGLPTNLTVSSPGFYIWSGTIINKCLPWPFMYPYFTKEFLEVYHFRCLSPSSSSPISIFQTKSFYLGCPQFDSRYPVIINPPISVNEFIARNCSSCYIFAFRMYYLWIRTCHDGIIISFPLF